MSRGKVVALVDGRTLTNRTVAISGGTIADITEGNTPPAGARVVNGQGRFLIPASMTSSWVKRAAAQP